MLNSGKNFALCPTKKKKYSNSRVVRKKNSERNNKKITPLPPPPLSPPPPFKLNGRSLMHMTERIFNALHTQTFDPSIVHWRLI